MTVNLLTNRAVLSLSLVVANQRGRQTRYDRARTGCLGVSSVLKESQLLAERSRNHTDGPMDGASVSQGRVLQCSFHPLRPSLSLARDADAPPSLSHPRHPSRHPHPSFHPSRLSLSLSFSPQPPTSGARTSILRYSPSTLRLYFPSLSRTVFLFKCHLADD